MKQTRNSIDDIWGLRTPYTGEWPERIDERVVEEPDKWVHSTCILCSNGCAMDVGVKDNKIVGVRGKKDRSNQGRLGPKGLHGWEANASADRLKKPLIRRNGSFEEASWDEAMELIVNRTKEISFKYSPSAIGFYTSGQLMLEEYYTLAVIGKAGLGTPHMDGNTRLCTATAAAALMETFGSDGQPGSYGDIDKTDAIFLMGHNAASQQTVLWMRILDRLYGMNPPKLVVVDPRNTWTADKAAVHLKPRLGTNLPLMYGILNLIIDAKQIDEKYLDEHTIGFESLKKTVTEWVPKKVEEVSGVPAKDLEAAADILGSTPTLVSTVLQGVYQSMLATASAVQINNLHLIRGLIGRPGCGILQMNGQPTSQNTRETGCNGALPAFRNWDNPEHIDELAKIWNVDPAIIPSWTPPTHAMQIFRYAEQGSIKMLWISATNPAVSLPDLNRIRKLFSKDDLFIIVQDGFMTETASLADVVLPAAIWAEKTGTFTNADRTVHLSEKAIDPPGEARSDLDIFLDFAKRMEFRDLDGQPLIKWDNPESAFEAWKECTRGRMCDYTGITYEKLRNGGIQWPCNDTNPGGAEHIYTDGIFNTEIDACETYGHDLLTGAAVTIDEYREANPAGRAVLKTCEYVPPAEKPDNDFPLWLTTGRLVYHWHTRTKTARSKELNDAAPDAFVQISNFDAEKYGIKDGDLVEVESRRGIAQAAAKVGKIDQGHIFMPFHYGYWDNPNRPRAANELTLDGWDPVSKQPYFKYAAAEITKIAEFSPREKEGITGKVITEAKRLTREVKEKLILKKGVQVAAYVGMLHASEQELLNAFNDVAENYSEDPELSSAFRLLGSWCQKHIEELTPFIHRYSEEKEPEIRTLRNALFSGPRNGGMGMIRDLQDLLLLANEAAICWTVILQTSKALRDTELENACIKMEADTKRQISWLKTKLKQAAPQALITGQLEFEQT